MQFSIITAAIFSALAAAENIVTFESKDSTSRQIVFTPTDGYEAVESVTVSGGGSVDVTIPKGWIGNWFSISEGASNTNGMLGEVAFQGWNGLTYFDVSAIVNSTDFDGVKEMWPASAQAPSSGCKTFPCDNAYYLPDDIQTKTTSETHLVCTLGSNGSYKRFVDQDVFPHDYVTGKHRI
ncbi:hypothetical protein CFIMG_004627RA [Ceratocystis fimbriata CBS 114723]|uniref:DNase1 protein n=1 Tax=Ceratocystis fimbriata CBS 114723 TaxID=1035309 RepID=A0A2C5X3A2_9PEZI|nr:hypothetical protein CFIMG_004627RA [Ceratocystis fimbriata CBS 114723]